MRAQQLARRAQRQEPPDMHRVPNQIGSAVTVPRRRRGALTAPPSAPATASRRTSAAARLCTGAPSPAAPCRRPRLRRPARAALPPLTTRRRLPEPAMRTHGTAMCESTTQQRAWATARVCSKGARSAAPSLRACSQALHGSTSTIARGQRTAMLPLAAAPHGPGNARAPMLGRAGGAALFNRASAGRSLCESMCAWRSGASTSESG